MDNNFINDLARWSEEEQEYPQENPIKILDIQKDFNEKEQHYLTERLNVRVSKKELAELKERSKLTGKSVASLIRTAVWKVNSLSLIIPDAEATKTLVEYRTNFARISNHFESRMWSADERAHYQAEILKLIRLIDKYLQR